MSSSNGTRVPNANQRARAVERDAAKAEQNLATLFGETLGNTLVALLPQILGPMRVQRDACLVCCVQRKTAERMAAQLAELAAAAAEASGTAEGEAPELPEIPIPDIAESVTTAPVMLRPDLPPQVVPVCYDHLPASGAEAGLPPQQRDTGLVGADGQPIVAVSR